ncbi:hypothetical protein EDC04DRAFT_2991577 [Pisolithus marmoratus]|nr:hypothetical protein EDC04DRAFT_2991577 [Pisolithus marmoratus]
MALDSSMGESAWEPFLGQVHLPLPCHHYDMQMNRDHELQDQLGHNEIYSRDDQFGYEGIPYDNPGWYDPPGRGSDVCYGPYHLQFILPPPFTAHHYPGYTNDPMICWPPGMRGPVNYTSTALPFCGMHNADHANPNGGCEWPARAYRWAMVYNPIPSGAGVLPDTQEGTEHSAGTAVTGSDVMSGPSDPPAGNIVNTSNI